MFFFYITLLTTGIVILKTLTSPKNQENDMQNLLGKGRSITNRQVGIELARVRIRVTRVPPYGSNHATLAGHLHNWTFERYNTYWRAKAKWKTGIPLSIAIPLNEIWQTELCVGSVVGGVNNAEIVSVLASPKQTIDSYSVCTSEALATLVALIKKLARS